MKLYDSAMSIANTFEIANNINCFMVDVKEPDGYHCRIKNTFCKVCASLQTERKKQLECENIHRHGIMQAEKWGGKYEYLCPAGAAFICATLQENGEAQCGIAAGPFLMVDLKEFINEDLEQVFSGEITRNLRIQAGELPYLNSGRVSHMANILTMITAYAVEHDNYQMRIMQQVAKSQSDIYDSLQELKDETIYDNEYPIRQEKILKSYIAQGDKAAAQKVLNEILGHIFFCSGGGLEYIKARIIELIVILSRAAIEGGADVNEVFGLNRNYISEVQSFTSLDDLNPWLAGILIRFTNIVFEFSATKHAEQIKHIMTYVRRNYMMKITLNDISSDTNLSVSYLSKIFKDETGQNISAYINQVRVENAKLFLLDESIPITDVSYLSGFDDQSYFSKVFKKLSGLTPGKYREMKGNI